MREEAKSMPTDFLANAKPVQQQPGTDYLANATAVPKPPPPPPQEGFLHSLGAQFGLTPEAGEQQRQEMMQHPIRTGLKALAGPALPAAEGLFDYGKRAVGDVYDAGKSLLNHNPAHAAIDAVDAIPIVGPAEIKTANQVSSGAYGGAAGTLLGSSAQAAMGLEGGLRAVGREPHFIPSAERAGAAINDIQSQMAKGGHNVTLTPRTLQPLAEARKLMANKHGTISALNDLEVPNPMSFEDAFQRSSALKDLTANDKLSGTKWLQGQAKRVGGGLRADTSDATAQIGRKPEFDARMREYGRAKRLEAAGEATKGAIKKYGVPAAIGAGAGGTVYRMLRHIGDSQ